MDSIKKNTVAATIAIEMIQNEMATASFGLRNPFKSVAAGAADKVVADKDAMLCAGNTAAYQAFFFSVMTEV